MRIETAGGCAGCRTQAAEWAGPGANPQPVTQGEALHLVSLPFLPLEKEAADAHSGGLLGGAPAPCLILDFTTREGVRLRKVSRKEEENNKHNDNNNNKIIIMAACQ